MKGEIWQRIQKNFVQIVENQVALSLLDYLYQYDVFTVEDCDRVRARDTPQNRNRTLLEILEKKPEESQKKYIEALGDANMKHLADLIRKTNLSQTADI